MGKACSCSADHHKTQTCHTKVFSLQGNRFPAVHGTQRSPDAEETLSGFVVPSYKLSKYRLAWGSGCFTIDRIRYKGNRPIPHRNIRTASMEACRRHKVRFCTVRCRVVSTTWAVRRKKGIESRVFVCPIPVSASLACSNRCCSIASGNRQIIFITFDIVVNIAYRIMPNIDISENTSLEASTPACISQTAFADENRIACSIRDTGKRHLPAYRKWGSGIIAVFFIITSRIPMRYRGTIIVIFIKIIRI